MSCPDPITLIAAAAAAQSELAAATAGDYKLEAEARVEALEAVLSAIRDRDCDPLRILAGEVAP